MGGDLTRGAGLPCTGERMPMQMLPYVVYTVGRRRPRFLSAVLLLDLQGMYFRFQCDKCVYKTYQMRIVLDLLLSPPPPTT